jgi:formylmethanofuran--tetrahydromethanopterin N-formyltransferase
MEIDGVEIEDTFAEAFPMDAARAIVTAESARWAEIAAREATGYATSVIACDAEAGVERWLTPGETPDGRPGASLLFFSFNREKLQSAVANRVGQCIMTCATTACYNGLARTEKTIKVGGSLRYFGDGFQSSKLLEQGSGFGVQGAGSKEEEGSGFGVQGSEVAKPVGGQRSEVRKRRFWRVPVMDGEFVCEDLFGTLKGVAGGNFLILAQSQAAALDAAEKAMEAIGSVRDVIAPFPGGIVRSGSKVGSRYKTLRASTNDAYCPTLRGLTESALPAGVNAVYEIVLDGLSLEAVEQATRVGVKAACQRGVVRISAGNYGGSLGPHHIRLREVLKR